MIKMPRALVDKVDSMQKQMSNVSTQRESKKQPKKKCLRSKTLLTEMKNVFGGLISRLNMTEERLYESEDMSIETSKTE